MIVCFQMLIRAAPLRPGLFLIEGLQSGAQLAADQLAVPTCVSECSCSCWPPLFYRHCSRYVLLQSKKSSEKEFAYLNPHNEASVCSYARLDSSRRHWRSNCPSPSFLNRRRQEGCIIHVLVLQPLALYWACVRQRIFLLGYGLTWGWHGHSAWQNGVIMTWTWCHNAGQTLTYLKPLPKDVTVWLLPSQSDPRWLEMSCFGFFFFIISSFLFSSFCFNHRKMAQFLLFLWSFQFLIFHLLRLSLCVCIPAPSWLSAAFLSAFCLSALQQSAASSRASQRTSKLLV